jgi:transcription termination/antitermination protein NusA
MSVSKNEFNAVLAQVAADHGIKVEDVISAIQSAVLVAYQKEVPGTEEVLTITAKINKDTGEIAVYDGAENITPPGFGRIAAQTARNVIMQGIRETEKKNIFAQFSGLVNTVVRGRIIRVDNYHSIVDIGRAEGIIPREEQIKNERFTLGESYTFLLKEIGPDRSGRERILLNRNSVEFLKRLFAKEVPEIASGTVVIREAVRESGVRAKIAVSATQSGIDPVGSCVGQKGVRVQTVTEELGGSEKIDIIQYSDVPEVMIRTALAPAKIEKIEINEKTKNAAIHLPSDQVPLAIGAGGVNVNLASRLTGYSLDIKETGAPQVTEVLAVEESAS